MFSLCCLLQFLGTSSADRLSRTAVALARFCARINDLCVAFLGERCSRPVPPACRPCAHACAAVQGVNQRRVDVRRASFMSFIECMHSNTSTMEHSRFAGQRYNMFKCNRHKKKPNSTGNSACSMLGPLGEHVLLLDPGVRSKVSKLRPAEPDDLPLR